MGDGGPAGGQPAAGSRSVAGRVASPVAHYPGRVTTPPRFVLASASPARRRTLAAAGIDAEVIVSGVDESTVDSSRPDTLCLTLARMKAEAVANRLRRQGTSAGLVLGCDSVLAFDGQIYGKPVSTADARGRWRHMRGHAGELLTGHCLIRLADHRRAEAVAAATVRFADITDAELEAYLATGEPLQVAGAFTIDGLGGPFVESITGDPGTVIGVSLPLLRRLLADLDVPITRLWATG
jgi:septum formation protein